MFNSTEYPFISSTALYSCNYGYLMKKTAQPHDIFNSTEYTCIEKIRENWPTEAPVWQGIEVQCHGR